MIPEPLRMLTKSTDWQSLRKPARQGSKLADKGAYTGVSDRRLQVKLTQEAKIVSDFSSFRAVFAFAGFVSALKRRDLRGRTFCMNLSGKLEIMATPRK